MSGVLATPSAAMSASSVASSSNWLAHSEDGAFDAALEEAVATSQAVIPSELPEELRDAKRRREEASPPTESASAPSPPTTEKVDPREQAKLDAIERAFAMQEEKRARKERAKAAQAEKDAADPCTCGHARSRRLPRPLAPGGPRCNKCVPLKPPRAQPCWGGPSKFAQQAPIFYPTEEEFADPMAYIRTIQRRAHNAGICVVQPPKSWQPPKTFHMRSSEDGDVGGDGNGRMMGGPPPAAGAAADGCGDGDPDEDAADEEDPVGAVPERQTSSKENLRPINDDDAFHSRLQSVKRRVQPPEREHAAPFTCSFTPKYAKYTVAQLRQLDKELRDEVFPEHAASGELPPPEAVEGWFWEGLASEGDARILYCSDLEGTAFPDGHEYGEHPWSPASLAQAASGLLRLVDYSIPGVNTPMLYLGMLFSMFCWHVEDNYMYSVSYLHEGAPKTWYGVPPADAHAFEEVHAKQAFAKEVHNDPTMVLKKNSMIPPSMLVDAGVRVVHAVQRPGQFIVTLPQGYHTGFSHGHNVAEAVNFVLPDWLPYAVKAMLRYRFISMEPVLDIEDMLLKAAREEHSAEVSALACEVIREELEKRAEMRGQGTSCGKGTVTEVTMGKADREYLMGRGPPCAICAHVCHLSFIQLAGVSDRTTRGGAALTAGAAHKTPVVCLNHEDKLEVDERIAAPRDKLLVVRYTDKALNEMLSKAEADRRRAETTLPDPIDGPEWPVDVEDEREKKREKLDTSLLKLIGIKA